MKSGGLKSFPDYYFLILSLKTSPFPRVVMTGLFSSVKSLTKRDRMVALLFISSPFTFHSQHLIPKAFMLLIISHCKSSENRITIKEKTKRK